MLFPLTLYISLIPVVSLLVPKILADESKETNFDEFAHHADEQRKSHADEQHKIQSDEQSKTHSDDQSKTHADEHRKVAIDINQENAHLLSNTPNFIALFHTEWCSYCKDLAPKLAKTIQKSKSKNKFFRIDCDKQAEICNYYNVEQYPTIIGRNDNSINKFNSEFTEDALLHFDWKVAENPYHAIDSQKEMDAIVKNPKEGVLLLCAEKNDVADINFIHAVKSIMADIPAYACHDTALAKTHAFAFPSLHYLHKHAERNCTYANDFNDKKALARFVYLMNTEFVSEIDHDDYEKIEDRDVPVAFFFYSELAHLDAFKSACKPLECAFKQCIVIRVLKYDAYSDYEEVLNLPKGVVPALAIHEICSNTKYPYKGDFSSRSLQAFFSDYCQGRLVPSFKSEAVPLNDDDDNDNEDTLVKKIVHDNFHKHVLDKTRYFLLLVTSPDCKYCADFATLYDWLARRLKNVKGIRLGCMNGIANDFPREARAKLQYFPTLFLYLKGSGGDDAEPVLFKGRRTKEELVAFLREHCKGLDIPDVSAEDEEVDVVGGGGNVVDDEKEGAEFESEIEEEL